MPSYGDRFDLLLHGLSLEMIQVAHHSEKG